VHVHERQCVQLAQLRGHRASQGIVFQIPALTTPSPHSAPPHISLLAPTTQTLSTIQHPWTCLSAHQAEWAHPTTLSLGWDGEGGVHVQLCQAGQLAQLSGYRATNTLVVKIPATMPTAAVLSANSYRVGGRAPCAELLTRHSLCRTRECMIERHCYSPVYRYREGVVGRAQRGTAGNVVDTGLVLIGRLDGGTRWCLRRRCGRRLRRRNTRCLCRHRARGL